ncbi:cyclic nucleotide-binding domain-containing protein [Archangium sp.]|uniref:cyclic nucleotide-binding domain-containing protein n=1 Tax=Archangium sp. TaxID=1872627 RepID=UPI002ED99929
MGETLRELKDNAAQAFASGKLEEALAGYQRVVKTAPEDLASRQKVAELLQRLGRTREALETYETVATAWARQGWLLRAIALCKVILQLEPAHGRTQEMLAQLYAKRLAPTPRPVSTPAPVVSEPAVARAGELPSIPLFSQLGQEAFVAVLEGMEMRAFQPGETIVTEGAPGSSMFAVVEGRVEVVRQLEGGKSRAVAAMGEGEFFGEMALLSEGPRLASVVAAERTVVLELTRAQVERLVQRHPSVGEALQAFHQERLLANVLRSNPLLASLSPPQREALARAFQPVSVPAGQTLLVQGQQGEALYLLLRGRCQVQHQHPDGHASAHPVLREGDVFGELSLLLGLPVTATVRSETPCTLLRLDRASCERHILSQPGVREAFSRLITERLGRTAQLFAGREVHEGDLRI